MTETQVSYGNLQELSKHNRATEKQARRELKELNRHQTTVEAETARSNRANESNYLLNLDELTRHNKANESETVRSNMANEALKKYAADLGLTSAQIAAASRIQAAGLSAEAAALVAKINGNYNTAIAELNNASREEIETLNRKMQSILNNQNTGVAYDRLDLETLKYLLDKENLTLKEKELFYKIFFGNSGFIDMPGKMKDTIGSGSLSQVGEVSLP